MVGKRDAVMSEQHKLEVLFLLKKISHRDAVAELNRQIVEYYRLDAKIAHLFYNAVGFDGIAVNEGKFRPSIYFEEGGLPVYLGCASTCFVFAITHTDVGVGVMHLSTVYAADMID